jgi:sec-independent protein translocase protein TatA
MRFGPQEILLLLLIVLLLFGATRLPKLARSMREARDEFQKGADDEAPSPAPPAKADPVVAKESPVPEAHTDMPEPAPTEQEKQEK